MTTPKNAAAIKCVVFDAAGTLMQPMPGIARAYALIGKQHGTKLTTEEIGSRFRLSFQKHFAPTDRPLATDESRDERIWKQIVTEVLSDIETPDECFEELYQHFGQPSAWALYDDVEPTIHALVELGYPIIVASNFDKRLHSVCDQIECLKDFPRVISTEVGFNKPAKQFYDRVVELAQADANETLMVGDDRINDVAGAEDAGLQAIWLDRDDAGFSRDLRTDQEGGESITSLSQLPGLLPGFS